VPRKGYRASAFRSRPDGTQATVEDAKGEVLSGQQGTLIQRFVGHTLDLSLTQGSHTIAPLGETVPVVFLTRVEGQHHRHHLALGQWLVARLVGRDSGHSQLPGLDRLRLGEPGEVDLLDQIGEGLGLELGATQPFLDPHDEDLVEGLDRQAMQLFTCWLSYHLALLLFEW